MSEQNLLKMFQGILSSQSFELLAEFSNEALWITLKPEEKEALAQLFLIHGEKTVRDAAFKGDLSRAKSAFDAACKLMPNSAKMWFRYGSYLSLSEQKEDLDECIRALEKSIELDGRFFDAHYVLGTLFLRLGSSSNNETFLLEADRSFSRAMDLVDAVDNPVIPTDFFWHWGIIHFLLGKLSGEPLEFQRAKKLYEKAGERGLIKSDFLNDFANTLVELSLLVGRPGFIEQAARLYEEAFVRDRNEGISSRHQAIRLFNAGCCYVHLYEGSLKEEYFQKAEDAFLRALVLDPIEDLFQKMGQLYFLAARCSLQETHMRKAIDSFQKAHSLGIQHPVMLAYYAQALLMLYEATDRVQLLYEAEEMANKAIEQEKNAFQKSPEPFLARALCLCERGKYFQDISFIEEAQEVLQQTLFLAPKSAYVWYAFASVKGTIALMENDEDLLKETILCYLLSSRSIVMHYSHFWNSWGLALLTLADLSEDPLLAEDACSKFEIAIELSQGSELDWIYNLGCSLDLLGYLKEEDLFHEQAIELFNYIEQEDSTLYDVLLQQAIGYIHLGRARSSKADFIKAEELLRRYLREEPEDEVAWAELGIALLQQSVLEEDARNLTYPSQAEDSFLKSIALGNPVAYYHLACLYAFLKDFPDSMSYLWKALEGGGMPSLEELLEEELLKPLHSTKPFQQFLREIALD